MNDVKAINGLIKNQMKKTCGNNTGLQQICEVVYAGSGMTSDVVPIVSRRKRRRYRDVESCWVKKPAEIENYLFNTALVKPRSRDEQMYSVATVRFEEKRW